MLAKSATQATSVRITSGAPELPPAAFLNLAFASPKGTLTYLTSTFGCSFSKPSARAW